MINKELEAFVNELKDFADTAKIDCEIIPVEVAWQRLKVKRNKEAKATLSVQNGINCPYCKSGNTIPKHENVRNRCNNCKAYF